MRYSKKSLCQSILVMLLENQIVYGTDTLPLPTVLRELEMSNQNFHKYRTDKSFLKMLKQYGITMRKHENGRITFSINWKQLNKICRLEIKKKKELLTNGNE